jgi:hypothetical protein
MKEKLHKVSAYLNTEELRQFNLWVKARGVTQSAYIREMLSFDIRERGAPKGPRQKKAQAKRSRPVRRKRSGKLSQISFLDQV